MRRYGPFRTGALDADGQLWVRAIIDDIFGHGFDFRWCVPQMRREAGTEHVPIEFRDLSCMGRDAEDNCIGWAACTWPDDTGIWMGDDKQGVELDFKRVLQHELGHVVDFFYLNARRRAAILAAYREVYPEARWHDVAHPFCTGFQHAFCTDTSAGEPVYEPVDPIPDGIRAALLP